MNRKRSSLMQSIDESHRIFFKYSGQHSERYNNFFNPNICHVCKSLDKQNLISCNRCCMISYCSKEHKAEHDEEHKTICTVITQVLQERSQSNPTKYSNLQEWIESRKELIKVIQQNTYRPLQKYEKQMILASKSCVICYQQTELYTCEKCFCINYCKRHSRIYYVEHDWIKCRQLMRSLKMDIEAIYTDETDFCYSFYIPNNSSLNHMYQFYDEYIVKLRRNEKWINKDLIQSDCLSDPLTVYFGLQKMNSLNILRENDVLIHVIGADFMDMNGLAAWEVLLHLVPEIEMLKVVMISPELKYRIIECTLCNNCKQRKRTYTAFSVSTLYHIFTQVFHNKKKPNVIVGFHVELSEEDTWLETIKTIQTLSCPLLLSSSSKRGVQKNIYQIRRVLGSNIRPIFDATNHFSGLAVHRNLEVNDTFYRNEYFIIYNNLNNSDDESTNSSCK